MNTYSLSLSSGSGQYIFISNDSLFNITGSMTLETWIKPTDLRVEVVFSKDGDGQGGAANKQYVFGINGNGNIFLTQQPNSGGGQVTATSNGHVTANVWNHIAAVFDASVPSIAFYINGSLDSTSSPSGTSVVATGNVQAKIGANGYSSILNLFNGLIDEMRLWNTVRSASDISVNYQRELSGNEAGLIVYYKLNNNYTDSSPNGETGNPQGTPTFSTDVPFADNTTTSTSTTTTSTSTSTTTTSTSSSTTTSTSSSTSTTTTSTSSSSSTSTTTTQTSTSTTTTSTSTTTTSTSTTTTSTSTTTTTSTSTSTTITIALRFMVERVK